MLAPTSELVWFATIPPIRLFAAQPPGPEPKGNDGQPRWGSGDSQSRVVGLSLMWMPDAFSQAVHRRELAIMSDRNDEGFFQRIGKGWRILRGLQARRMRGGSGTLLVQRPTKATNYMTTKLAVIANQLSEDAVAVITSDHDNVDNRCCCTCWLAQEIWCIGIDAWKMEFATVVALNEDVVAVITSKHINVGTRCWRTCWLAQVIWCIGGAQGDAHSIASSVLAVAVVTI